jgi:DNA-binding response OmpR family regulator
VEENLTLSEGVFMAIDSRIQAALQKPNSLDELRSMVDALLRQGQSRDTVLALLEQSRRQLNSEGRDAEEDVVMDVMDFLTGWCSPHMKLPADKPV